MTIPQDGGATISESRPIAMLIDGDNAQPALIEHVLAETAKYGNVTTRRIYGDWTTPQMSGWKVSLHTYAIQPMQQFRNTRREERDGQYTDHRRHGPIARRDRTRILHCLQ